MTIPDAAEPTVLFVSGFHRSGTTLVTTAATRASGGATLTVGHLSRHIPTLASFLAETLAGEGDPVDRGVDRLGVTASTPEEYGWLLHAVTGQYAFRDDGTCPGTLRRLIRDLRADSASGVVVLKNPWDTGREALLLEHVAGARVLLLRRRIAAIETSLDRALTRAVSSDRYLRALLGDRTEADGTVALLTGRWSRAITMSLARWYTRISAVRLARAAARLPAERVAFLSYEELRQDPVRGSMWASHVVDPEAFAQSFAANAFAERGDDVRGGWLARAVDWYWERAWLRARTRQREAGLLPRRSS